MSALPLHETVLRRPAVAGKWFPDSARLTSRTYLKAEVAGCSRCATSNAVSGEAEGGPA
jgi:hypothetical protein